MAQAAARMLARQQLDEGGEFHRVDLLALVELPDQWAQLVAEFDDAADEVLDLVSGLRQCARFQDPCLLYTSRCV